MGVERRRIDPRRTASQHRRWHLARAMNIGVPLLNSGMEAVLGFESRYARSPARCLTVRPHRLYPRFYGG